MPMLRGEPEKMDRIKAARIVTEQANQSSQSTSKKNSTQQRQAKTQLLQKNSKHPRGEWCNTIKFAGEHIKIWRRSK